MNWLPFLPLAEAIARFAMEQAMKKHPQKLSAEERKLRAGDALAEIMRPR